MAGATANSMSGGCEKAPVDYSGSNTQIVTYYPPNDGAVYGTKQNIILNKGTIIDRFGGETGKYFAPAGTPIYNRALPYGTDLSDYHQYIVEKPLFVESSTIAPAFGQIGGGTQYHSYSNASTLIDSGFIREIWTN